MYKLIELFGELLKDLFVPSDNYFSNKIDDLKLRLSEKIPYEDFINMFGEIEKIESSNYSNISLNDYKIGNNKISINNFINFNWLLQYKDTWYAWVRGIFFILLIIYNINQIMKLFRGYNIGEGVSRVNENSVSGGNVK